MKSIQRELMELILTNREALSLPENLQADFLPTEGDALSFQSDNVPKLAKSYISGTSEYNYAFSILAVTDGSVHAQLPPFRHTDNHLWGNEHPCNYHTDAGQPARLLHTNNNQV